MSENAQAGHGSLFAMELDPSGSPGTFTVVAEQINQVNPAGFERPETETTASQDNIDYWQAGRLGRQQMTFTVQWVYNNNTHDDTDGLVAAIVNNETRGFRFRGPSGSADTDERICSGFVQAITFNNPIIEGVRTSDVTIRCSGPEKIDGTIYGS